MLAKLFKYCIISAAIALIISTSTVRAGLQSVEVNCPPPKLGTYRIGWGTSGLQVPEQGEPYAFFRTERYPINGYLCGTQSDGAVAIREDGSLSAFINLKYCPLKNTEKHATSEKSFLEETGFVEVASPAISDSRSRISVEIDCQAPETGLYHVGWGGMRLVVSESEPPHIIFSGSRTKDPIRGLLCKSRASHGLIRITEEGDFLSYVESPLCL